MSNDDNPNLAEIKKTYHLIDDNFDTIYAKCDASQKAKLIALRDAARDTFWRAIADNLSVDHDIVAHTVNELTSTNTQIEQDLTSLANVTSFLDTLTQGVKLAAALATLAAA
jgi:hypothetical protein